MSVEEGSCEGVVSGTGRHWLVKCESRVCHVTMFESICLEFRVDSITSKHSPAKNKPDMYFKVILIHNTRHASLHFGSRNSKWRGVKHAHTKAGHYFDIILIYRGLIKSLSNPSWNISASPPPLNAV